MKKYFIIILFLSITIPSFSQESIFQSITEKQLDFFSSKYGKTKTSIILNINNNSELYYILANDFDKIDNGKIEFNNKFFKDEFNKEEEKENLKKFKSRPRIIIFKEDLNKYQYKMYDFKNAKQQLKTELSNLFFNTYDEYTNGFYLYRYLEVDDILIDQKLPLEIAKEIKEKIDLNQESNLGTLISVFEYSGTYLKKIKERECSRYSSGYCLEYENKIVTYKYIKLKFLTSNFIYNEKIY
jgi:hypothetical protein